MTRICIVTSHRAERGLLQPLIDRLVAHPTFDLDLFSLDPDADHVANYDQAGAHYMDKRPDIVIIPCDRAEALDGALAVFELGAPIIHFHAGDVGTASKDEMYRHAISLMASVHLCNGPSAKKVVCDMLKAVGRPIGCVYDVGSTAMDDVEIDISMIPDEYGSQIFHAYELVLYHPPRDDPELINNELDEIENILTSGSRHVANRTVFWGYPNGDPGSKIITKRIEEFRLKTELSVCAFSTTRPKFLGLMKYCKHFIGNSSSMVCEAQMWLSPEQIIHIGDRNRNRSFDAINPGATDRIIEILEEIAGEQI